MGARHLCLLALLVVVLGCHATPEAQRQSGVTASVRLVGKIKPASSSLSVGEDLIVDYWITALANAPGRVRVEDGSNDPEQPFQGYSFNAALASNPEVPMDLIFLGQPVTGQHTFDPEQPIRFQRIRWRPRQPGTYKLTFVLEWKKDEIVAFDSVTVSVAGRTLPTERTPFEVRPEVVRQVKELMAQLSKHLKPEGFRQRAEIKAKIKKLGSTATVPLIRYTGNANESLRIHVTNVLIEFGRGAIPALIQGCGSQNSLVRYRCAYTLGKIREAQVKLEAQQAVSHTVAPVLIRLGSRDTALDVRHMALTMLARYFEPVIAVPALLGGLSDASKPIRQACNRWLKQMSATDVGYVPNMRPDEQKAAIARWRKFWENKLK